MKMRHLHSAGICRAAGSVANRMLLLCMLGIAMPQATFAAVNSVEQRASVSGVIIDANTQETIVGASVLVKGTTTGAVTDIDGKFTMAVDKLPVTLVVTYVGYQKKEVKVSSQGQTTITLSEDSQMMDEVIVTGYGTFKKSAYAGSAANVKADKIADVPTVSFQDMLQGNATGVQFSAASGQPGASSNVSIRGMGSINASNTPLYVIDGVPVMGGSINSIDSDAGLDIMSTLNTNDIASITVIKDAAAASLYGSRAANGVIIITTNKGAEGTPAKVSYNGYFGFKKTFHKFPMMNGKEFAALRKAAGKYENTLDESDDTDTDWQDMFFKTGITTSHDVSVAGGTKGGSYSFGAGYYHDESVVPTQGFNRISVRGNFDQNVGKYFHFGLSTNNSYREIKGGNVGLYNVLTMSPLANPYDEEGNLKRVIKMPLDNTWVLTKDVAESLEDSWLNESKGIGSYNTLFAEVKCPWIQGLSYRINVGLNYRSNKQGAFTGTGIGSDNADSPNSASVQESVYKNWAVENLITYDHTFAEKHHVNVVGMYSAEQTTYEQTQMSGQAIPAEYFQYYNIGAATKNLSVNPSNQNYWQSGLMSWMGRLMYSYDNKYMASVTFRADASSRLAKGHQWHTYPAVSVGWNIARENFMQNLTWLDNLKLRIGYGETSNQSINPYSTLGALSTRPYNFGPTTYDRGFYVSTLPNTELGWEYSSTWNFGVDFSLFQGRLSGTLEYYIQDTKDLLLGVSLPSTSGVNSYTANVGKTRNKGIEFSLNGTILDGKNGWTWDAGINLYANKNKLVALASGADRDLGNRWFVGHPIDVIYDYKKIGLWQKDDKYLDILEPGGNVGMIKVEYTGDYNEDGTPTRQINSDDMQIMDMDPDLMGGFNTTVGYKNFDLTFIGSFQIGGKLVSALHSSNGYLNLLSGRRNNIKVDYWTEDNTNAKYPKPGGIMSGDNPKYGSTLGYFDAGYLKIRTITLGYNFDKLNAIKNLGISKLRVYCSVQNPFVFFSPFKNECGLDPETNTLSNNGSTMAVTMDGYTNAHKIPVVGYNTPSTRNFIFGINATF